MAAAGSAVERSETSRLQVYPELSRKKAEKVRRYVGRVTTSVVLTDFEALSDLVVSLAAIDLVSVDGPWWELRPASDVYRQARLAAAADALRRARDYAEAFGAEVVSLVEVADLGMSQHDRPPHAAGARFMLAAAGQPESSGPEFDLEPERQQVTGQVEARFVLSQPDLASLGRT